MKKLSEKQIKKLLYGELNRQFTEQLGKRFTRKLINDTSKKLGYHFISQLASQYENKLQKLKIVNQEGLDYITRPLL